MRRHLTDVHQVQDPSKCCKYKVQSNFKRYGIYYCVKDVHVTEAAEVPSDVNNKRAALIEALPFTAEISNTDDYTSNADFTDHRERLTNEYMNALKVTQFIIDMLPSDKNNIEGRQLLNKFRSKEKNNVSAEFNHIRYAVETCFFRLQKVLKKLPWGAHFFAEQQKTSFTKNDHLKRDLYDDDKFDYTKMDITAREQGNDDVSNVESQKSLAIENVLAVEASITKRAGQYNSIEQRAFLRPYYESFNQVFT